MSTSTLLIFPKQAVIVTYLRQNLPTDKDPLLKDTGLIDIFGGVFTEQKMSFDCISIKSAEVLEKYNPNLKQKTFLSANKIFTEKLIACAQAK